MITRIILWVLCLGLTATGFGQSKKTGLITKDRYASASISYYTVFRWRYEFEVSKFQEVVFDGVKKPLRIKAVLNVSYGKGLPYHEVTLEGDDLGGDGIADEVTIYYKKNGELQKERYSLQQKSGHEPLFDFAASYFDVARRYMKIKDVPAATLQELNIACFLALRGFASGV